jgi:protein-tyrosine-phosphatase
VRVLFYGSSNATRGPLAEAIGRQLDPHGSWYSAGLTPTRVHPMVKTVLSEEGIRPEGLVSKGISAVPLEDVELCIDLAADLPRLPPHIRRLRWLLPDPSSAPAREQAEAFRAARDELRRRIRGLLA